MSILLNWYPRQAHPTVQFKSGCRKLAIRAPKFKSPLLSVALADRETGKIAFAPLQLELGKLTSGTHTLDITAFGNRLNALGCLHNADEKTV